MRTLRINQGNTPKLKFTILVAGGTPLDLTGSTVLLIMQVPPGDLVSLPCTITTALSGKVEIRLLTTHTATAGIGTAELQVAWPAVPPEPALVYTTAAFEVRVAARVLR